MFNSTSVGLLFTTWEIQSGLGECCPGALSGLFLWLNGTHDPHLSGETEPNEGRALGHRE